MKNQLKRKLRSSQGMTLLLSLLLFLVCAVAGSVVLAAGTATSGTLSERAKLDQRYFSVTSAAELIRQKFDGKSVRVTVTGDTVDVMIKHGDSWIARNHAHTEEKFVIDQSVYLLDKRVTPQIQWSDPYPQIINDVKDMETTPPDYTLKMKTDDGEIDSLQTTVTVNFTPSGLTFQLENGNGDSEKFRLNMEYVMGYTEIPGGDATIYSMEWHIGKVSYGN
ncbi:MAG: hypothetical protein IJR72_04630 [Oscillospiraceae bacterium]|nr:hypothetical protein [Oscillospiraceae bacterium]